MNKHKLVPAEPTDDELLDWAGEEQFFLFCDKDDFLQIARAVMQRYAAPQPTEQQPAPDVTALADALTMARETIAFALRTSAPDYFTTDADIAQHVEIQRIDAALAEWRQSNEGK